MAENGDGENLSIFRDCLSTSIIEKLAPVSVKQPKTRAGRGRKSERKSESTNGLDQEERNDLDELSDFVEVHCVVTLFVISHAK